MEIQINEDYKITSDPHNLIINQQTTNKEGEKTGNYKQIAFVQSLEQAAIFLFNREIRVSEANTFEELLKAVSEAERVIREGFKGAEG